MSLLGRGVVCATLLFTWLVLVGGVQIQRRQLNLPPGIGFRCISTFLNLVRSSAGTRTCLARLGENVAIVNGTITVELTVDQLEFACGSTECQEAFVTLIEACENEVRSAIDLPDVVDLHDLLLLLCVRDPSGAYCYYELEDPILRDDSDPLLLCNLLTPQQSCTEDCKAALDRRSSTCCLASYLYLVASDSPDQQAIATSVIWQSCNLTAPSLCPSVGSNAQLNNDDDDDDNNGGTIAGAVIGGLAFIVVIAILVVVIIYFVFKYRTRSFRVSGHQSDDKVKFADKEHSEATAT